MHRIVITTFLFLLPILIGFGQERIRPVVDTIGFAQYDWQMDSIVSRLNARIEPLAKESWKAVIAPHDDYKYAGEVTFQALSGINAGTVILFGVAHKASSFKLEDKIVFGSFSHWDAPYGKIPVSAIREDLMDRLPGDMWVVHDSMQMVEHSLEALNPFLQRQNLELQIIPILVPYMDYKRIDEISGHLSKALQEILKERNLVFGEDVAIVISNDAVHYGDEDWGGKNIAPFGTDAAGNGKAVQFDRQIIQECLTGAINPKKVKGFVNYTVMESDHREYKWTWCGRYAIPMGLMTANKLNNKLYNQPLNGIFLNYATSIDHELFPVEDLGMGTTAPANQHHWVGFAAIGYR